MFHGQAGSACLSFFGEISPAMRPGGDESDGAARSASLDVRLSGRVQGVGFRYFSHEAARRLGLVGYVMNLRDGGVRAYAEGPREALEAYLRLLREGPRGALVRQTSVAWGEATGGYSCFSIQPTR